MKIKQAREEPNQLKFILEEDIPKTQNERKQYVADIAIFYGKVFKKKLQHFIGLQLEELAKVGRTEQLNDVFRANISCFRLIDEWMVAMTSEHFGNQQEIRDSFEVENFISEMKETYGENKTKK